VLVFMDRRWTASVSWAARGYDSSGVDIQACLARLARSTPRLLRRRDRHASGRIFILAVGCPDLPGRIFILAVRCPVAGEEFLFWPSDVPTLRGRIFILAVGSSSSPGEFLFWPSGVPPLWRDILFWPSGVPPLGTNFYLWPSGVAVGVVVAEP
jgi:hypothetical protein